MSGSSSHPFDEPTADIIICSADNITFRVHKIILSLASDFFRDMFSLPQPSTDASSSTEDSGGLPTVHVAEPGDVLERLFRLCYPIDDPVMETIKDVCSTLEAAMKYQMSEATKITKRKLRTLATSEPLRVYAVACRFNLEEEASAAAKEVFKQKAQERYVDELEDISFGAYHRLLSYCERRGRVRDRFRFTVPRQGRGEHVPDAAPCIGELSLDFTDTSMDPRIAPPPFDSTEADVSLVTSDGVEFRVYSQILELASPILSSKIHEKSAAASKSATITVDEHSRIISLLLHICYPTSDPVLEDLHDISSALAAAEKYEMQKASQVLRAALMARKDSTSEDPVVLYAIGCRFGMRELASAAARRTLRIEIMRSSVSELDSIGVAGACLYRLLEYHRRCKAAVRTIFESTDWIEEDMLAQLHDCCRRGYNAITRSPCWYERYMKRVAEEAWPRSDSVTKDQLLQSVLEPTTTRDSCTYCSSVSGMFLLIRFSKYVAETIEALEKRVPLQWASSSPS